MGLRKVWDVLRTIDIMIWSFGAGVILLIIGIINSNFIFLGLGIAALLLFVVFTVWTIKRVKKSKQQKTPE